MESAVIGAPVPSVQVAAGTGAAGAGDGGDPFAALLASLMEGTAPLPTEADGASAPDAASAAAVPPPTGGETDKPKAKGTDLDLAAMLAAALQLAAVPTPAVIVDAAAADKTSEAGGKAAGVASASAPSAGAVLAEMLAANPTENLPTEAPASTAETAANGAAVAIPTEAAAAASTPAVVDAGPTPLPAAGQTPAAQAAPPIAALPPTEADGKQPPAGDTATAPPDETALAGTTATTTDPSGVVRTDGDANTDTIREAAGPGRHDIRTADDRKEAKASTGGMHAVAVEGSGASARATTEVATPTGPARPEAPSAVHDVARVVATRTAEGGGEARLVLHPGELGQVEVRVHVHDAGVTVEVHADQPAAAQLLQDHRHDLEALLTQRGLDLSGLYVGLGGGQAGGDAPDAQHFANQHSRPDAGFAEILGPAPTATHNRLRAAYNPDGNHVYRI